MRLVSVGITRDQCWGALGVDERCPLIFDSSDCEAVGEPSPPTPMGLVAAAPPLPVIPADPLTLALPPPPDAAPPTEAPPELPVWAITAAENRLAASRAAKEIALYCFMIAPLENSTAFGNGGSRVPARGDRAVA